MERLSGASVADFLSTGLVEQVSPGIIVCWGFIEILSVSV
jgi:hypothetical protein